MCAYHVPAQCVIHIVGSCNYMNVYRQFVTRIVTKKRLEMHYLRMRNVCRFQNVDYYGIARATTDWKDFGGITDDCESETVGRGAEKMRIIFRNGI